MEKSEFLERLSARLKDLPDDEVQEIIGDYEEHFAAGVEAGRTETAIAAALGDPDEIGKQLCAASHLKTAEQTGSFAALCRAALATFGLGLFNFCIALVPIVVAASIIFAIFVTGVSLALGGGVALGRHGRALPGAAWHDCDHALRDPACEDRDGRRAHRRRTAGDGREHLPGTFLCTGDSTLLQDEPLYGQEGISQRTMILRRPEPHNRPGMERPAPCTPARSVSRQR